MQKLPELFEVLDEEEERNAFPVPPLLLAVQSGDVPLVEDLLDKDPASIQGVDYDNNTVLHRCDSPEMMKTLLARLQKEVHRPHRAAVNQRNSTGQLPLDVATSKGHLLLVVDLLKFYYTPWRRVAGGHFTPDTLGEKSRTRYITQALTHCIAFKQLPTHLDLSGLYLNDAILAKVAPLLAQQGIQQLNLSRNQFSHGSGKALTVLLQDNSDLRELNLSNMVIGCGGRWPFLSAVQQMARTLAENKTLLRLNLSNTCLNNNDLLDIIGALKKNYSVRFLDLTRNHHLKRVRQAFIQQVINLSLGIDLKIEGITAEQQAQLKHQIGLRDRRMQPLEDVPPPAVKEALVSLQQIRQCLPPSAPISHPEAQRLEDKYKNKTIQPDECVSLVHYLVTAQERAWQQPCVFLGEVLALRDQIVNVTSLLKKAGQDALTSSVESHRQQVILAHDEHQDYVRHQRASLQHIAHFEAIIQHKLSMYWTAVSIVNTQLVKPSYNEINATVKRIQMIISLVLLLPSLVGGHIIVKEALNGLKIGFELVKELLEYLDLVAFVSKTPGIHQAFHHLADQWVKLQGVTQETMLKNVQHAFFNLEDCQEQCLQLAKAISHTYAEPLRQVDSREDMERLANATAEMVLDFYKLGLYSAEEQPGLPSRLEDAVAWLFFGSVYLYKKQHGTGEDYTFSYLNRPYTVSDFYSLPGLEFEQRQGDESTPMYYDLTIRDDEHSLLRTKGKTVGLYRRGSRSEAIECERQLCRGRDKGKEVQKYNQIADADHHIIEFDADSLRTYQDVKAVSVVPFTFLTKTQRLGVLETEVVELKNANQKLTEDLSEERTKRETLEKELRTTIKSQEQKLEKEITERENLEKKFTEQEIEVNNLKKGLEKLQNLITPSQPTPPGADDQAQTRDVSVSTDTTGNTPAPLSISDAPPHSLNRPLSNAELLSRQRQNASSSRVFVSTTQTQEKVYEEALPCKYTT